MLIEKQKIKYLIGRLLFHFTLKSCIRELYNYSYNWTKIWLKLLFYKKNVRSGALHGIMLLVKIVKIIKFMLILDQVRLCKGLLCPAGLGKELD